MSKKKESEHAMRLSHKAKLKELQRQLAIMMTRLRAAVDSEDVEGHVIAIRDAINITLPTPMSGASQRRLHVEGGNENTGTHIAMRFDIDNDGGLTMGELAELQDACADEAMRLLHGLRFVHAPLSAIEVRKDTR